MDEIVVITHVCFEDTGLLGPLLAATGKRVRTLEAAVDDVAALDPLAPALVVVLGGPIGVGDSADYPFLGPEIALLERRLGADRPTLGICLGAQLMARALGAAVVKAPRKEIGWAPLTLTAAGERSCLRHAREVAVLHWHGDNCALPAGAVGLASTAACPTQAFTWGKRGLALQFHLEATARGLERWFVGHTVEIAATAGVDVATLRRQTAASAPACAAAGTRTFEAWLASVL